MYVLSFPDPAGALCPGDGGIWAKRGFWRAGPDSSEFLECPPGFCLAEDDEALLKLIVRARPETVFQEPHSVLAAL